MLDDPHSGAMRNLRRQLRLRLPQLLHAGAQPQRIQRAQDKGSMAALRAAQLADQMLAGARRRIGQRRIHNLHQKRIT
jgi:hypothetical protein